MGLTTIGHRTAFNNDKQVIVYQALVANVILFCLHMSIFVTFLLACVQRVKL